MSSRTAPDFAGVMVGWRAWRLVREGGSVVLHSVIQDHRWPPRAAMQAECGLGHTPPVLSCRCGLYAARSREWLQGLRYHYPSNVREIFVIGEVELWGELVEADEGFRSQFAYPRRILVGFEHWSVARELRAGYGVTVQLGNTFASHKVEEV
jgi:hypothetical protein